ncbi:hypothetical protein [Phenylobacterium sp.]|jgi:Na+(H+)/acetate symporter ActP|uniref:hypothetical protein n=1 Tax=Phenylobacterium sp. TaxID=1871053 RepID=UPI002F3F6DA4
MSSPPTAVAPDMIDRLLAATAFAYVSLAGVAGLVLAIACLLSSLRRGGPIGALLTGLGYGL